MAGYALTDLCAKSRTLRKLAGGAYALAVPAADGPPQLDRTRMAATVVISTPDVDRSGDVVVTRGIRTDSHKANPVVLFEHGEKGYALPVGKAEDDAGNYTVVLQPDRAVATTYFSQSSKDAETVYALIDEGILRGASVGFRPLKAEYMPGSDPENPSLYLEEIELVEYSHVVIPDNAGALRVRVEKGLGAGLTPELRRALAMAADLAPRPPVPVTDPRTTPSRETKRMATYADDKPAKPAKGRKAFDPEADDADGYGAMDDAGTVDKAAPDDGLGLDDLPPNPDAAADLAGDHPEPDADDAAAPADDRPPGAQALESVYTQMMAVGMELGNQMRRQENPEVRAHLEAVAQQIEDAAGAAAELYADQYPDLDPLDDAGGADDAPAGDAADADAPAAKSAKKGKKAWEGDGPASRRLALRMAAWRTKRLAADRRAKRLSRSRLERLKAAADMYDEMANDKGMTPSRVAACKYHANALRDLYTAGGGTGDEDEAAQMDKHARELMAKKLADMEGTVAKLTRQLRLARTGR